MKCPFVLPVEPDEELLMLHINGKLRASLIIGNVDDWNDEKRLLYLRYIVKAINCHEKQVKHIEALKSVCEKYIPTDKIDEANDEVILLSVGVVEEIGRKLLSKQALKESEKE